MRSKNSSSTCVPGVGRRLTDLMEEVEVNENYAEILSNYEYFGKRFKEVSTLKNPSGTYSPGASYLVTDLMEEVEVAENCAEILSNFRYFGKMSK